MSRVIAAVDNSAAAAPVLAMARYLARVLSAAVEAVHVGEEAGQTVRGSAGAHGIPLRTIAGDPLEVLTDVAGEEDVVALVLGARGHPGRRRPAGHLAIALADRIDKPLLVVPPDAAPAAELRRLVIGMEGVPGKAKNLKRAIDFTGVGGIELIVLHVDDEASIPMFSDQVQHETESFAREFLARYCPGLRSEPHLELRIGTPADELLAAADQMEADVLVIGWPQSAAPGHGPVAREILDRSRRPVLLVATE